jgi:Na+/H+-dicarboxylate symporter
MASLSSRTLAGLGVGVAVGGALAAGIAPALTAPIRQGADLIGVLFVNAIRMTVLPLVVSSLVAGVGAWRQPRAVGRLITHALVIFAVFSALATLFGLALAWPVFNHITLDPHASLSLRAANGAPAPVGSPGMFTWLSELFSPNPFKAAADEAVLPLIFFALLIGLAFNHVPAERREVVIKMFEGVRDALLVLVGWVLHFAPIGVCALALSAASRLGVDAVTSVITYIVVVVVITVAFVVIVLYPAGLIAGFRLETLIRGLTPAQSLAFSSRSTLASLPAMMTAADRALALAPEATACLIPLAASLSRVGGAVGQIVGVLFLGHLYGIEIPGWQLPAIVLVTVLATLTVPGVPGGSIIAMVPVLAVAGVPAEGLGILLGLDAIPDMFRTTANVTGGIITAGVAARYDEWFTADVVPAPGGGNSSSRLMRRLSRRA